MADEGWPMPDGARAAQRRGTLPSSRAAREGVLRKQVRDWTGMGPLGGAAVRRRLRWNVLGGWPGSLMVMAKAQSRSALVLWAMIGASASTTFVSGWSFPLGQPTYLTTLPNLQ